MILVFCAICTTTDLDTVDYGIFVDIVEFFINGFKELKIQSRSLNFDKINSRKHLITFSYFLVTWCLATGA